MWTETLWQEQRRAARSHWWRQVLDRPPNVNRKDLFDEELAHRFRMNAEAVPGSAAGEVSTATPC